MRRRACRTATGPVLALTLTALSTPGAAAQPGYQERLLDNGLRVILIPHRASPMVASSVIVGAGVVHEPEGLNGVSHFLEHLLFNGTTRRTQRQLYNEVDLVGAYNNATTREDHTLFTLLIQKEFAETGLDIQADMLFHSTLPPDKFEKEKGIVLEELAKDRNDPQYVASTAFRAFAYAGTPLARPVLGSEESIRSMKREDVLAYYRSRYVPANMTLVVMGDFDAAAVPEMIRRTFGEAAGGSLPAARAASWPPPSPENLRTELLEAGRVYLEAAYPLGWAPFDPRLAAAELWVRSVAGGADSPLGRALQGGTNPLVLAFDLGVVPRADGWSSLEFHAVLPSADGVETTLSRLAEGLQSIGTTGALGPGLSRARRAERVDEILLADQIHYYAMMRSSYIPGSPEGYLAARVDLLDLLGEDELQSAAARLRAAPAGLRIQAAGPGLQTAIRSWKPPAAPATERAPTQNLAQATLPSGLEVVARRNDDSRVFAVHLLFRPRSAAEPAGKEGIAALLHRIYPRGSRSLDRSALAARLDELGARIKTHDDPRIPFDDYYTTWEFSFVRLEMPVDRWREGLGLVADLVRRPRLDPSELEAARNALLDVQQRQAESTRSVARRLLAETLAPGHPSSRPVVGTAASLRSLSLADLQAFHAAYVTGRRMILTVVGAVDPQELVQAVDEAFAGLPAGEEPLAVPPAPVTPAGAAVTEALGKQQAYIALAYLFEAEAGEVAPLRVAGALLSDRLAFELREKQGLAYSLSAAVEPYAGRLQLLVLMGTRQENVDRALQGLRDGLAAFRGSDLDPTVVRRAANALRGRLLMRRLTRVNQAYFLGLERLEGRAPGSDLAFLDELLGVDAARVRAVVDKYVDPDRCVSVVVR